MKVLVNSYANDGNLDLEQELTREDVMQHLGQFEKIAEKAYTDDLREEEIWDLQEYIQKHYRRLNAPFLAFWEKLAFLAPRLPLSKRAELYAILWGRHEALTALYIKLVEGLARLGFAEDAFVQLKEALLPSETSILNVDTLKKIGETDTQLLKIATLKGSEAELPRSVVAALTAELRIVVAERPRDYYDYTDLLDFPGYRSRKPEDLKKAFATGASSAVCEMLLRGKVDYLFQRYTADLELTGLLLCLRDLNLDVKSLPAALEDWIEATHGATAEDRVGRPTTLFLCLTFFDNHFVSKPSDDPNNLGERFASRLQASLIEPFGNRPGSWPADWTPGKPFNNCYWIRNPNITPQAMIDYDADKHEIGIKKEKVAELAELRADHGRIAAVIEHFKEPGSAFDAVMTLNDGGVTYLSGNLAKVCLPDMKSDQVRARLNTLRKKAVDHLAQYYVTTDIDKRLLEREAVYEQILAAIDDCVARNRFGTFLANLCIDRVDLSDALWVERTSGSQPDPSGNGAPPKPAGKGPIASIVGGNAPSVQPQNRPSGNLQLGNAAMRAWTSHMQKMSESEPFARAMGIPALLIREAVAEISGAARRKKLNEQIASRLDRIIHLESNDAIAAKATTVAARLLNDFVATFGYDLQPVDRRPKVPVGENKERPVFLSSAVVHDASGIGAERRTFQFDFAVDWCIALRQSLRENASTEDGSMQDPVQNARLGKIVDSLRT